MAERILATLLLEVSLKKIVYGHPDHIRTRRNSRLAHHLGPTLIYLAEGSIIEPDVDLLLFVLVFHGFARGLELDA